MDAVRAILAESQKYGYIVAVNWLTNQEKWVIGIVLGLLVTGWVTKTYRAAHLTSSNPEAKPATVLIQASP